MILCGGKVPNGSRLGKYLLQIETDQEVRMLPSRELIAPTLDEQFAEMKAKAAKSRASRHIYHVQISPGYDWTDQEFYQFIELYEREFGLQDQARIVIFHKKSGRGHWHGAYSLVRRDGKMISMAFDYLRNEKLSRVAEFEFGESHVTGRHNFAVASALLQEGRSDIVESMKEAGLLDNARPVAEKSSIDRYREERATLDISTVERFVLSAWHRTIDAIEFSRILEKSNFKLGMGEHSVIIVDPAGEIYSLRRLLSKVSYREFGAAILAEDIKTRLGSLPLKTIEQIKSGKAKNVELISRTIRL